MFARDGHTDLHPFNLDDVSQVIGDMDKETPVYLTVDLDVLDPSVFPGTGTPEADGVTFRELLEALLLVCG